jgi:hypothetical protein
MLPFLLSVNQIVPKIGGRCSKDGQFRSPKPFKNEARCKAVSNAGLDALPGQRAASARTVTPFEIFN